MTEELVTLDSVADALCIELWAMARKLRDEATADTLAMALGGGDAGEVSRRADLATHERVHALLLEAGQVGAR